MQTDNDRRLIITALFCHGLFKTRAVYKEGTHPREIAIKLALQRSEGFES